ncbi:MAG: DNA polymerase [Patescibacteria group bacterium]
MANKKKLVLIDGNALVHRAFHAFSRANLASPSSQPTGAIYGFAVMLINIYTRLKPDYIAVAFDTDAPTFRHKEYVEYKATRIKAPQELYDQIPEIQALVESFNIPIFLKDGFEADDIIGTLARQAPSTLDTYISTGDMDALQLVNDHTFVYAPRKGFSDIIVYTPEEVLKTKGLRPDQIIDFKGLRGDPSDNIPGVAGIGEITALKLLQEFGDLENIYKNLEQISGTVAEKLKKGEQDAIKSKGLATIHTTIPIKLDLDKAEAIAFDKFRVAEFFRRMGFRTLYDKIPAGTLTTGGQPSFFDKAQPKLIKTGAGENQLIKDLDKKLDPILRKMEKAGILLDIKLLNDLNTQLSTRIEKLKKNIYKYSKVEFNIASPSQLGNFLFKELKLPTLDIGKTQKGYSTAVLELEKIYREHPVIKHILEFRQLEKLRNTYLETLPKLVDKNNRVHTTYAQDTSTGRLSSKEPNLQNIPIRSEIGAELRKAFIAPKGFRLISADYSQIELRVIASLAHDVRMIRTFNKGEDIHTAVAAEVNGVKLKDVTKDMRRNAKTINFGIIYGVSPYGLAARTNMTIHQATNYIHKYFELHPEIKQYMEDTAAYAKQHGYVETLFGRRRYIPEIRSKIPAVRSAASRAAINMPVQGTAADLLKAAMIELAKALPKVSPDSRMLLQVHDELVLEVPTKDIKKVATLVRNKMENVYHLDVPIHVDIEAGVNWGETKKI